MTLVAICDLFADVSRESRGKRQQYTIDGVALTPQHGQLAVLLAQDVDTRVEARDRWALPSDVPRAGESLQATAQRIITKCVEIETAPWMVQVGAFAQTSTNALPTESELTIAFVALVPMGTEPGPAAEAAWFVLSELPQLPERQEHILQSAVAAVRDRLDLYPVAFRLLPAAFTLSELQQMYELLLGRRLHKASFRRALQAAWLVEPTDEWRSEGRGRPAQLFRYSPRKRRRGRRGVRFDLLG